MARFTAHKLALCFIMPQVLITLVLFIWPVFLVLSQSFSFGDAFGLQKRFAWFANYVGLFADHSYIEAIGVTLILAVFVTILTMGFGLLLALLVLARSKGQGFYKTLLVWPYAVAPAIAAILWRFLCHPTLGWLPHFLLKFGIDFNYVTNARQALFVVIVTASWQQFSYNFLFYYSALQKIPTTLIDAAIIDGASAWGRFWQIVVPILSPTTFFLLIMNLIYAFFDTFGIIHIMTHGGPEHSTTTLIYKVYVDGFIGMDIGSSAAQSVLLMFLVVLVTLLQFRYLEQRVHYA